MHKLKIREIAEARGISIRKLYFLSEVDEQVIRRIWRDPHTTLNIETLDRLARALNVDIRLLIESDPPGKMTLE